MTLLRGLVVVWLACLVAMNSAVAATCDVANPVLPCEVGSTTYDTFAGNYSGNRSFYRAASYDVTFEQHAGYLCLVIKDNLPHTEGYAFAANYGPTVWTSPAPYNVNFGIFGQFSGSCIEQANNFEWIGAGSPSSLSQPIANGSVGTMAASVIGQCLFGGFCAREGNRKAHSGVDLAAPQGTPVRAICDGKVLVARREGAQIWNRFTIIEHMNCGGYPTLFAYYGHVNAVVQPSTSRRTVRVKAGDVIGTVAPWPDDPSNAPLHFGLSTVSQPTWGYVRQSDKTSADCLETSVSLRIEGLLATGWLDPAVFGATRGWSPFELRGGSVQGYCNAPEQIYVPEPVGSSVPYYPWAR